MILCPLADFPRYAGLHPAFPRIAEALARVAAKEGAEAIAHGATGNGNDQVRFELTIKALAPHLKIIAPWRMWDIKSREDAIDFAEKRNIPIPVTKARPYSMDENLYLSSRNLPNVLVLEVSEADPVSLVRFPKVLVTKGAVAKMEEIWQ